jgi:hypothetical protein
LWRDNIPRNDIIIKNGIRKSCSIQLPILITNTTTDTDTTMNADTTMDAATTMDAFTTMDADAIDTPANSDTTTIALITALSLSVLLILVCVVLVITIVIAVGSRRKRSFTTSSLEHLEEHIYDVIPEKRAINFGSNVPHFIPYSRILEPQEKYKDIDKLYEEVVEYELVARYEQILNTRNSDSITRGGGILIDGFGRGREAEVSNQKLYEVMADLNAFKMDGRSAWYEKGHVYSRPSSGEDYYKRAQVVNQSPSGAEDCHERAQVYERVPDVDFTSLLSSMESYYERAEVYERVPDVDIALLLSQTSPSDSYYERAQVYERVPDVDMIQLLRQASQLNNVGSEVQEGSRNELEGAQWQRNATGHESVTPPQSLSFFLSLEEMPIYEPGCGERLEKIAQAEYERVYYTEAVEQMVKGLILAGQMEECNALKATPSSEQTGTYERVQYSKEVEEMVNSLQASTCDVSYERVKYSAELENIFASLRAAT